MTKLIRSLAVVAALSVSAPLMAQGFDAGYEAFLAGDYETALDIFVPLAEQGDAYAQYGLGVMYLNGEGVLQDYAEAARWFQLACPLKSGPP